MLIKTPIDPIKLARESGIEEKYLRKPEQYRDKPVIHRTVVGGAKKLTFTMLCNDACLKGCRNRDTYKCGDECFMFSNYKADPK